MIRKFLSLSMATLVLSACQTVSNVHATGEQVSVNQAVWNKSSDSALQNISIPNNQSRIVFIRPSTNHDDQSSANIALNDHYLTSLQANRYTESLVCSGDTTISVVPTGVKINNLQALPLQTNLKAQTTYYYLVDVDKTTNRPVLTSLNNEQAQQLLNHKALQTHQISRIVNNCPSTATVTQTIAPVAVQPIVTQQIPTLRLDILFDYDKSTIKPQYQTEITKAAQFLANYPTADAIIEGHTDSKGSDSYNQQLSQRRAEAVRTALISQHGINANRISAVGYGESRPVASNDTDLGRQENRRVMLVIKQ